MTDKQTSTGGSVRTSSQLTGEEKVDLVADVLQKQKDGKLGSDGEKKVAQADGVSHTVVCKTEKRWNSGPNH